jgi:hypothetical protein
VENIAGRRQPKVQPVLHELGNTTRRTVHDDHGVPTSPLSRIWAQQRESTLPRNVGRSCCTEVMMFGGLFFVYTRFTAVFNATSATTWGMMDPFYVGSQLLNQILGLSTPSYCWPVALPWPMGVLLCSNAQSQDADEHARADMLLLGAAFPWIKAVEWTADWHEGLVPGLQWFPEKGLMHDICT